MALMNKIVLWLMLTFKPVSKVKQETKPHKDKLGYIPVRLLEIGELIVYHLQSNEEFLRNDHPKEIYWTNRARTEAYGPFT
jgi:hypothetical protein